MNADNEEVSAKPFFLSAMDKRNKSKTIRTDVKKTCKISKGIISRC